MVLLVSVCYAPSFSYADVDGNSNAITYNEAKDSSKDVNYESILGDAMEYGIVADKYVQNGHSENNFATKYCYINNSNISPDLLGEGDIPYLIKEFDSKQNSLLIDSIPDANASVDVYLSNQYEEKASSLITSTAKNLNFIFKTSDEIDSQITSMQDYVADQSKALAAKEATIQLPQKLLDQNQLKLDTTTYADDAVIYVDVPEDSEYNSCNCQIFINMKSNQVVVFNYRGTTVKLNKNLHVTVDGKDESVRNSSYVAEHIFWNLPNATSVELDQTAGTFIIPQKTANISSFNMGGILVTGGSITCDGEWHYGFKKRQYNKKDAQGSVELKGVKNLENRDFQDGDSWTFKLAAVTEGAPMPEKTEVTIDPTSGNSEAFSFGKISFTKADLGDDAEKEFEYTITESGTVAGVTNDGSSHTVTVKVKNDGTSTLSVNASYDNGDSSDKTDKAVFVNTFDQEKTSVDVTKKWDDDDNLDQVRPDSITVNLLQNGEKVDSAELNEDNQWKHTFSDLDKYDSTHSEYEYTVEEEMPEGVSENYTAAVTGSAAEGFTITNTHESTEAEGSVELKGAKNLKNREFMNGDSWTFKLSAVTEDAAMPEKTEVTINPTSGSSEAFSFGKISFTRSDLGRDTEKIYQYKITESGSVEDVTNDSNEHYVTVKVQFDGSENLKVTATYDNGGSDEDTSKAVFVNTFKKVAPAVKTVTVEGTKIWVDQDNSKETRPEKITLNLLQNGKQIQSMDVTPDKDGNWNWSFGELDKCNEDGVDYTYTVEEVAVDGYEAKVEKTEATDEKLVFTVTNTLKPEDDSKKPDKTDKTDKKTTTTKTSKTTKKTSVPETGDSSNLPLDAAIILIGGLALAGIGVLRRKSMH